MTAPILERLISQLKMQGKTEDEAIKIAKTALIKSGSLNEDGSLTQKGIERGNMTPGQRAISRAAAKSGRSEDDYVYDPRTNTARISWLKK